MSLADKSSTKSRSQNSSARASGAASDLSAMVSEFECTERGGERDTIPDEIAQPQRHRHERQHDERKKRRIGEAGIANLQHLAVPEARRRLRVGLHAGGEFHKARIISG